MSSSDDEPALSLEALKGWQASLTKPALQEFYNEQKERQEYETKLELAENAPVKERFEEIWNLSQFWVRPSLLPALTFSRLTCPSTQKTLASG